jgi:FkbM family methyltransferase
MYLNAGNVYPFTVREHPRFNQGLVATVREMRQCIGRPLSIIDVGAAFGDTVNLLESTCPGAIARYLCVDGDAEFSELFRVNTAGIAGVSHRFSMVAATVAPIRSLVRHHAGTAAAVGEDLVVASTIDAITEDEPGVWNILKTDVDGFDGEAIAGAQRLLRNQKPAVYFEWHPALTTAAANDALTAFRTLASCGYQDFVWFWNRGPLSHFSGPVSDSALRRMAEILASKANVFDAHFDVLALPPPLADLALPIGRSVGL